MQTRLTKSYVDRENDICPIGVDDSCGVKKQKSNGKIGSVGQLKKGFNTYCFFGLSHGDTNRGCDALKESRS